MTTYRRSRIAQQMAEDSLRVQGMQARCDSYEGLSGAVYNDLMAVGKGADADSLAYALRAANAQLAESLAAARRALRTIDYVTDAAGRKLAEHPDRPYPSFLTGG